MWEELGYIYAVIFPIKFLPCYVKITPLASLEMITEIYGGGQFVLAFSGYCVEWA